MLLILRKIKKDKQDKQDKQDKLDRQDKQDKQDKLDKQGKQNKKDSIKNKIIEIQKDSIIKEEQYKEEDKSKLSLKDARNDIYLNKIEEKKEEKKEEEKKEEEIIEINDEKKVSENIIESKKTLEQENQISQHSLERKKSDNMNEIDNENSFRKESTPRNMDIEYNEGHFDDSLLFGNHEMTEIKNRLSIIESKLNELNISLPLSQPNQTNQQNQPNLNNIASDNYNKKEIDLIKKEIKNINKKTEEIITEKNELKKKVEEISVKVGDCNIAEILKNALSGDPSQIDVNKLYSLSLEQKFQRKTNILDEKTKKADEEINKIKNNFDNIKLNFEAIEQNFTLTKNNIKDLREEIIKSNIDYRNLVTEINDKLNESLNQKIEALKKGVDKNLNKLREQIKSMDDKGITSDDGIKKGGPSLSDNDLQYITELSKKVSDVEKQISIILRNIEALKNKDYNEITKIENDLIQKVNQKDFFELNDKVNLQNTISNNIREMVERVQDLTNKNMNDLNFFLRKIESLSGSVISMQSSLENLTVLKQDNQIDLTNYLDQDSFNEFVKNNNKDKKIFERNFDEFRRILTDLSEIVKTKAGEEDLKSFETIFINKLEELKINCGKKFADKIDTSKNFKYLDAEIKYINEFFLKKDKNNNWLIAKKPVGGYSCASCETYIGDLKERGDFLPWNKYPQREKSVEKNYRLGNGFSRMLNMLNIDIKNSVDNNFNINNCDSDDENNQKSHIHHQTNNTINFNISQALKTSSSNKNKNYLKKSFNQVFSKNPLPKISSLDNILNNESVDSRLMESARNTQINNEGNTNNKKPCIVKVFRKK